MSDTILRISLSNSHELRVAVVTYRKRHSIDIRRYYFDGEEMKPTRQGVRFCIKDSRNIRRAIKRATAVIRKFDREED
jgi:hypothetical protein